MYLEHSFEFMLLTFPQKYIYKLQCEGVMIWVPLVLFHCELSNEYQYEGSIVRGGDDAGTIGFVSLDLFHCELSNECQYEGSIV